MQSNRVGSLRRSRTSSKPKANAGNRYVNASIPLANRASVPNDLCCYEPKDSKLIAAAHQPHRRWQTMKKFRNCTVLLVSLLLLSAGVNYIFIGTAGGRAIEQAQQVRNSMLQQTSAVDCTLKHCSLAVR